MTVSYIKNNVKTTFISLLFLTAGLNYSGLAYSQVRENPDALELPAEKNKALIEGLIIKIDNESHIRQLKVMDRGEVLPVSVPSGETPIAATLNNKILYLLDKNCSSLDELSTWSLLFYPLHINTSSEADFRTPLNLKHILKKNGSMLGDGASTGCISHAKIPNGRAYKIVGYKNIGKKRSWFFEKKFAEKEDYQFLNRIEKQIKLAPKGATVCKAATRLCYRNNRKREYVADLTAKGLVGKNLKAKDLNEFYIETKRTYVELLKLFPNFDILTITPTSSNIASFVSENLKHTVVVSVRDNAMRYFKETDLLELKRTGVDLSGLEVRGAHVSILKPGNQPINISDNQNPVTLSSDEHGVPNLGIVYSAGFAMGDHSIINLSGENISPNIRGVNIAVIDSNGRLVTVKNFDTHISPNRSNGLYKVSVDQ